MAISSPSPNWMVTRISPLIRTNEVKLIPAATQYSPCAGGTSARMSCSCCMGSGTGPDARSATMNGWVLTWSMVGAFSSRLMPNPTPMPVMKNAGTPPMGACSTPKQKNDANSAPLEVVGWA